MNFQSTKKIEENESKPLRMIGGWRPLGLDEHETIKIDNHESHTCGWLLLLYFYLVWIDLGSLYNTHTLFVGMIPTQLLP